MELLEQLTQVRGASGDENAVKEFILQHIEKNNRSWKVQPNVVHGRGFQDCIILVFGQPRTAIYAHIDTIGFTVGYENSLIKIGGPRLIDGMALVGSDSQGEIETELMVIESEDGNQISCVSERVIDRGTNLTFKPNFRLTNESVQSPYLDNRLGVWNALRVAETMEDGAIVFSTYEEHGGNSVGFCANYLLNNYGVHQALISDITWVTHGVHHGKGVAISMRDKSIPRRSFLKQIITIAEDSGIPFQLEVESAGGSDGSMLQYSHMPIDWCFIGAAEDNVHTDDELVYLSDISSMTRLYIELMDKL